MLTLKIRYRPEANGGRTSVKARVKWVIADADTFGQRVPNLAIQNSTILTEIQWLRFQSIATPSTATKAEREQTFENVNLLQSLIGGSTRNNRINTAGESPGKFYVSSSRRLRTNMFVLVSQSALQSSSSMPELTAHPLMPTYDCQCHANPPTESCLQRSVSHHQPSILSPLTPATTDPPLRSATSLDNYLTSRLTVESQVEDTLSSQNRQSSDADSIVSNQSSDCTSPALFTVPATVPTKITQLPIFDFETKFTGRETIFEI